MNRKPQLLLSVLRRSGAIGLRESVTWYSPLESQNFKEYQDGTALSKVGILNLKTPLNQFWPRLGPVWDALGVTSEGRPLLVEAKAHIAELSSSGTKASPKSRSLIERSLDEARQFYAPRATASWSCLFYQYANRLAHHYFLRSVNGVPSILVFLYFVNAHDMLGPTSEEQWQGAVRLVHAALGLPNDLARHGVFDAFLDATLLQDAGD